MLRPASTAKEAPKAYMIPFTNQMVEVLAATAAVA
jgi:hypothetical protein